MIAGYHPCLLILSFVSLLSLVLLTDISPYIGHIFLFLYMPSNFLFNADIVTVILVARLVGSWIFKKFL